MASMNFPLSPEIIAAILGPYGPLDNVRKNWPLVEAALDRRSVYSPLAGVAAISTIGVETGRFNPVKEGGGPTYFANLYDNRQDLGNVNPGDGVKFRGRGFVQITGRANYAHFGAEIGQDLEENPDMALDPAVAADILALYFHERHVHVYADQQNWVMVRRRVNGGLAGWPRFSDMVTKLVTALNDPPPAAGISQEVFPT
jgi:Chitinase class I